MLLVAAFALYDPNHFYSRKSFTVALYQNSFFNVWKKLKTKPSHTCYYFKAGNLNANTENFEAKVILP